MQLSWVGSSDDEGGCPAHRKKNRGDMQETQGRVSTPKSHSSCRRPRCPIPTSREELLAVRAERVPADPPVVPQLPSLDLPMCLRSDKSDGTRHDGSGGCWGGLLAAKGGRFQQPHMQEDPPSRTSRACIDIRKESQDHRDEPVRCVAGTFLAVGVGSSHICLVPNGKCFA